MHTGRRYEPLEFFRWTSRNTLWLLAVSIVPTTLYAVGLSIICIPWQPIAILGTALAFIVGFKNNASYGRTWEARQIYGSIINDSRSFAFTLRDVLGKDHKFITEQFFNRHFAWLTALRFQLREPRPWENMKRQSNVEYQKNNYTIPEWNSKLDEELKRYLPKEELTYVLNKKNRVSQITAIQSEKLYALKEKGLINDFEWTLLQNSLQQFTDNQGKAERIKNFPYPRQFSSGATYLMFVFVILLPFGLLHEFEALGTGSWLECHTIWLNIPVCSIVAWVFSTLDEIGESGVNPFEGSANDVPITQISRLIEIDMRDMLDEKSLPEAIQAQNKILL